MRGVRSPFIVRKDSKCESSHGGLSELHADEKLSMHSPTPQVKMNGVSNSSAIYGLEGMSLFENFMGQRKL